MKKGIKHGWLVGVNYINGIPLHISVFLIFLLKLKVKTIQVFSEFL